MKTHLILYTLATHPGRNPNLFPLAVQSKVDPYAKELFPGTWIVRTNVEVAGILNLLQSEILPGDKVAIINLPSGTMFASVGFTPEEQADLVVG